MSVLHTFFYELIRPAVISGVSFSFRHVYVKGYEQIKHIKPILFAPNHQITFLDGIVIVRTAVNTQPHILVRSDIFKSATARAALKFIRLLPVYRKRDNMGSLTQNEQIFNMCHEIFNQKGSVILFPEGSHALSRRLRTLQKGISRIALGAEEKYNQKLGLHIVPVGINFEHYLDQYTDLHLHFGAPIKVNDYMEAYNENPNKTMLKLKDEVEKRIKQEIIHIEDEAKEHDIEELRQLLYHDALEMNGWPKYDKREQINAEQNIITAIEQLDKKSYEDLIQAKNQLKKSLAALKLSNKANLNAHQLSTELIAGLFALLLLAPLGISYRIINLLPDFIINQKILPIFKDKAWWRSIAMGSYIVVYPVYFGLISITVGILLSEWLVGGMVFFGLSLLSIVGKEWTIWLQKLKENWRLFRLSKRDKKKFSQLMENKNQIINSIKAALGK